MGQNIAAMIAVGVDNAVKFLKLDASGNLKVALETDLDPLGALITMSGAQSRALNQTALGVIKTGAGRFYGLLVNAPGTTSGAWALNDCATTGAIAATNLMGQVLYNATANVVGALLLAAPGGIPFTTGLVLSVPGAGSPIGTVLYS